MLAANLQHIVPELMGHDNRLRKEVFHKVSKILSQQAPVISNALKCPASSTQLCDALEKGTLQDYHHTCLSGYHLSILIQGILWQDDLVPSISSTSQSFTDGWDSPEDADEHIDGGRLWVVASSIITQIISKAIQTSASSKIVQCLNQAVKECFKETVPSSTALYHVARASIESSIQETINNAVLVTTMDSVESSMWEIRERMCTTRKAVHESLLHTVEGLFPVELPIGLRIPKPQNSRIRQLWFSCPESAFCLWRTSRAIQCCEKVKHKELQKYIGRRIKAHSRDTRLFGGDPSQVEDSIRDAMSRVWLVGSMEVTGLTVTPVKM